MINIAIDPYILAYPNDDKPSSYEFEDYLERIIELDSIKKERSINFIISGNTSEILISENNFPHWDTLEEKLLNRGLKGIYQPKDIITKLEAILKYSTIEDILEINDIVFNSLAINPNLIEVDKSESYLEELRRLLMYICISHDENFNSLLMTTELTDNIVTFTGELSLIERKSGVIEETSKIYSSDIVTVHSVDKLFQELDPIETWKKCIENYEYDNVLYFYIFQRTGRHFKDKIWSFGKDFFETLRSKGFSHEDSKIKSLLKTLADTILYENPIATHALRSGVGGNSPQITRNNDKAYRRDIDYEYHLHYWDCGNRFEFASLVVHSDMYIPR